MIKTADSDWPEKANVSLPRPSGRVSRVANLATSANVSFPLVSPAQNSSPIGGVGVVLSRELPHVVSESFEPQLRGCWRLESTSSSPLWLARLVSNDCLKQLRSSKNLRQVGVNPWKTAVIAMLRLRLPPAVLYSQRFSLVSNRFLSGPLTFSSCDSLHRPLRLQTPRATTTRANHSTLVLDEHITTSGNYNLNNCANFDSSVTPQ